MPFMIAHQGNSILTEWQYLPYYITRRSIRSAAGSRSSITLPVPSDAYPGEQQIFMPYFLFHWDPQRPRSGKGASRRGGIVTRW